MGYRLKAGQIGRVSSLSAHAGCLGRKLRWADKLPTLQLAKVSRLKWIPLRGPRYSNEEIATYLDSIGANYQRLEDAELLPRLAEILDSDQVVGWFQGRMEFGPRALGGRSIIGDPRSPKMQSVMNLKIKYRESFRLFRRIMHPLTPEGNRPNL